MFSPTYIVIFFLSFFLIITCRFKRTEDKGFSQVWTQELKGLAILTILFAHISYYLLDDARFLFPFNAAVGVGVTLFLLLSGLGLSLSAFKKKLSLLQFYKKRLSKLYLPACLAIIIFLLLDYFILQRSYSLTYIIQSLFGFFPRADLVLDLNSPLWYLSLIIFYYLIFPIFFSRRFTWLSALALYLFSYLLLRWQPGFLDEVVRLYRVHIIAFPLGVFLGSLVYRYEGSKSQKVINDSLLKIKNITVWRKILSWPLLIIFLVIFAYYAYHSNVGGTYYIEELTAILSSLALMTAFLIKNFKIPLLYWFGLYSYEIYLLHWPILSRFDIFYFWLPRAWASLAYLVFFILIAYIFHYLVGLIKIKKNFNSSLKQT